MDDKELLRTALRALEDYDRHTRGLMIPQTRVQGREAISAIAERLRAQNTTHPADGQAVEH